MPHLGQVLDHAVGPSPHIGVHGGGAKDDLVVRDAVDHACLGGNRDIVADIDMPDDADLPADGTVVPDVRRAGHSDLGHEQAVGADPGAVTYGYHVAQFAALPNHGITQRASLNPATRADFDVVLQDDNAGLRYLVMYAFMGGVAKTVFANG